MSGLADWLFGAVVGFGGGVILCLWASNLHDDERIKRGHFEQRGKLYLIEPAKVVRP